MDEGTQPPEIPELPGKVVAVELPLEDGTSVQGLAVEIPTDVTIRDGRRLTPGELVEQLGFVSVEGGFAAASVAGRDWRAVCMRSCVEVRSPDGFPLIRVRLVGAGALTWPDLLVAQGDLLVISGAGVTLDTATGDVSLETSLFRWLRIPVTDERQGPACSS
ncbi:hypothetical protein [Streptomyces sp. NPDC058953]|uniref:hypothetical protein n=1 Tax=unclassified Streptomyces TaxID=2593676 RepID=UPI00367FBEF5